MKQQNIPATDKSLAVELKQGELNFSGCSIINDPKLFFTPIEDWVKEYVDVAPSETIINIKLEYMDSASVKSFFEILKFLTNINSSRKIIVNWHYEYYDPEILELGEIMQSKLDFEFLFHEYREEEDL